MDLLLRAWVYLFAGNVLALRGDDINIMLSLSSSRLSLPTITNLIIKWWSLVCKIVSFDSLSLESLELVSGWSNGVYLFFILIIRFNYSLCWRESNRFLNIILLSIRLYLIPPIILENSIIWISLEIAVLVILSILDFVFLFFELSILIWIV